MRAYQGSLARREYSLKSGQRYTLVIGSVLLASLAAYLLLFLAPKISSGGSTILVIPLLVIAACLALVALRSQIIIEGSRITVCNGLITRSADIADIEGFRTLTARNASYIKLYLKDGLRRITISNSFATDDDFRAWLGQIPDLDQRDREQILAEISQQQDLGATPEERLAALSTAKSTNIAIIVVAIVSALFLNVADNMALIQITSAILLALAPAAAFLLISRAPLLYAIFKRKSDPRNEISFSLIVAGIGFFVRNRNVHMVSMKPLELVVALVAIVYFAAFFRYILNSSSPIGAFMGLLAFVLLYSFAMPVTANTLDDPSPVTHYSAPILRKHISSGKSTTYYLDLGPWGPIQNRNSLSVPRSTYNSFAVGDQVCLAVRAGRLNAPWYERVDCAVTPDFTQ